MNILASHRIPTLKEKPFAITYQGAVDILNLYNLQRTYFQVCVQRRFSNLCRILKDKVQDIGKVYSVYAEYTLDLKSLDSSVLGWRSNIAMSGGGATLDLGYHTIDLMTNLFGKPDRLYAQLNFNSLDGDYTIDDTAKIMLTYDNHTNASLMISKIHPNKTEKIRVFGQKGCVTLDDRTVNLLNRDNVVLESHILSARDSEFDEQLEYFIKNLHNYEMNCIDTNQMLSHQFINMSIIESVYNSHHTGECIKF